MRNQISFYLNGKKQDVAPKHAHLMLADYLRYHLDLTGTKVVCAEGDCGACTVLKLLPADKYFLPVNACIAPVSSLDTAHILTIESLANDHQLHQAQQVIVDGHATQCGYCTPGIAMALSGLCEKKISRQNRQLEKNEVKNALTGNLCRCTGLEALIRAGEKIDLSDIQSIYDRYHSAEIQVALKDLSITPLKLVDEKYNLYAPTSLDDALLYKEKNKNNDLQIIAAATDLAVQVNKRKTKFRHLLSLHLIPHLRNIKNENNIIKVGASVTISSFRNYIKSIIPELGRYCNLFASPQIKNTATVIGNIANASPIGDLSCALLALNAELCMDSVKGERRVALSDFFIDYKKFDLKSNEIISSIEFKLPDATCWMRFFKFSLRRDLDISIVNMSFCCSRVQGMITDIKIAVGGVAATTLRLKQTEVFLNGKKIEATLVEQAVDCAQTEFNPISDARGSASYRRVLVANAIRRFFNDLIAEVVV